eukprot:sb/3474235/
MKTCLVLCLCLVAVSTMVLPVKEEEAAPQLALQANFDDYMGYLETVIKIYYKIQQIKYEIICDKSVGEMLEMLGLPEIVESMAQLAWMWKCENKKPCYQHLSHHDEDLSSSVPVSRGRVHHGPSREGRGSSSPARSTGQL